MNFKALLVVVIGAASQQILMAADIHPGALIPKNLNPDYSGISPDMSYRQPTYIPGPQYNQPNNGIYRQNYPHRTTDNPGTALDPLVKDSSYRPSMPSRKAVNDTAAVIGKQLVVMAAIGIFVQAIKTGAYYATTTKDQRHLDSLNEALHHVDQLEAKLMKKGRDIYTFLKQCEQASDAGKQKMAEAAWENFQQEITQVKTMRANIEEQRMQLFAKMGKQQPVPAVKPAQA